MKILVEITMLRYTITICSSFSILVYIQQYSKLIRYLIFLGTLHAVAFRKILFQGSSETGTNNLGTTSPETTDHSGPIFCFGDRFYIHVGSVIQGSMIQSICVQRVVSFRINHPLNATSFKENNKKQAHSAQK